ncbi:acylphosphatase [[Limnothrix rosea] IAM M-220]|uniref:acylphosphatase n=1 Tax=[Limnothrix rosea] IAM M-220 TaxID=454133 RepID=UPI00095EE733|nr:acylphosphatase [[Limnothrix rosea] IAM M-220]OKH12931.1 acylphosphatase [[Limnothrix rosea] IAM M-220]
MGQKAFHVWISGRVQGVSYRYYTGLKAKELGIRGWVKNLPDGRVEAWFEGTEPLVIEMLQWCRKGSPLARVMNIEQQLEEIRNRQGFRILR